jgi:ribonuclease P protein component
MISPSDLPAPAAPVPAPLALDLPRRAFLRASAQFQAVFRDGRRLQGSHFRVHAQLHALPMAAASAASAGSVAAVVPGTAAVPDAAAASSPPTPSGPPDPLAPVRLGITVSKRVDKRAVGRNRIRRQVRECFRLQRPSLPPGDYVVLALAGAARQDNAALRVELLSLFERARTLKPRVPPVTMRPADATERHPPSAP